VWGSSSLWETGKGRVLASFTNVSGQWYNQNERRNSMAKANEFKAAEKLTEYLNNANFSPAVMANVLTTEHTLYTQDRLMELVKYIIQYNSLRLKSEWDKGYTSEGLLMADALNDILEAKYGAVDRNLTIQSLEETRVRDSKYIMDLDSF
jgi:hypothetical protein